jgi:apolipoprotein N-acyltransferase
LLAGLTRDGPTDDTFRNQVVRVLQDGTLGEAYDKINIVPFGEYVPFRSVLGDFPPLQQVPRDAIPGTEPVTHTIDGIRVASIICFETLFPSTVRAAVADQDANLLVAVTNDSSFGETAESAQHVAQSQLRAVETGRSVVHASISGTSALIEPDGTVIELAPLFEVATIRATVPLVSGSTPAATVAPILSGVLAVLWVASLGIRLVLAVRARAGREGPS